jgi:hypothetical protein
MLQRVSEPTLTCRSAALVQQHLPTSQAIITPVYHNPKHRTDSSQHLSLKEGYLTHNYMYRPIHQALNATRKTHKNDTADTR